MVSLKFYTRFTSSGTGLLWLNLNHLSLYIRNILEPSVSDINVERKFKCFWVKFFYYLVETHVCEFLFVCHKSHNVLYPDFVRNSQKILK